MAEPNSLEKIVALCKSDKTPIAVGEAWAYHTALRHWFLGSRCSKAEVCGPRREYPSFGRVVVQGRLHQSPLVFFQTGSEAKCRRFSLIFVGFLMVLTWLFDAFRWSEADTMRVQSGILWGEVMRILWKETSTQPMHHD